MPPPHTAVNALAAIKRILAFWWIPITVVVAALGFGYVPPQSSAWVSCPPPIDLEVI